MLGHIYLKLADGTKYQWVILDLKLLRKEILNKGLGKVMLASICEGCSLAKPGVYRNYRIGYLQQ